MSYPPLPQLAPRQPGESAEAYGLRALAFAVEHGPELVRDDEALALADHVFPIVVSARGLMLATLDRLAETQRRIRASQRRRAALAPTAVEPQAQDAPQAAQAAPGQANGGGGGSKVPRRPKPQGPAPATALQLPSQPAAVADPF